MVDQSREREDGSTGDAQRGETATATDTRSRTTQSVDWLTASILRIVLAIVGVVLLLYALGQAIGEDLLEMAADALTTTVGQWLVIALFALILILVAFRGFGRPAE